MALLWGVLLLLLAADAKTFLKIGDGQCNGGVGGTGEHFCLVNGTCNEGGQPVSPPTEPGTRCPGSQEYLLCEEDTSINVSSCQAACDAESTCVGFLITSHAAKGAGRCELHTKLVEYAAAALECYTYVNNEFTLIGRGACRTRVPTVGGPQSGTHYGNMEVKWVADLAACEEACQISTTPCVGVEYHRSPVASGDFKCEVHFEELSASEMSIFECHAEPTCRNAHTCSVGVHKDGSATTPCAPDQEGGLALCSDALCCSEETMARIVSRASPLALARLVPAVLGLVVASRLVA